MDRVIDAIYERGMLKPLQALDLSEHQRVRITIHELVDESPAEQLDAWQEVYQGLTDEEITQIETLMFERSHFMRQEP